MDLKITFVLLAIACGAQSARLKCSGSCTDPKLNVNKILDLLERSKPIFEDIKALSTSRIEDAEMFTRLSVDEQKAALEIDLAELKKIFESNGHIPFPSQVYRSAAHAHVDVTAKIVSEVERTKANIQFFADRGSDLYGRVSKIRRPIMAELAGVSLGEWSSYLDDESKPIPFPLSCTLPQVRESKAFRTKAAADLQEFAANCIALIEECDNEEYGTKKVLDLLDKSRPIFAEIKSISEYRLDNVDSFLELSSDDQKAQLLGDLNDLKEFYESTGHTPFPSAKYETELEDLVLMEPNRNQVINFYVRRGADLYKEVSNIRRPIMAEWAGVSLAVWSSYLDDETKEIQFPLACTLPHVRRSKAFRTKAAADLKIYGDGLKIRS